MGLLPKSVKLGFVQSLRTNKPIARSHNIFGFQNRAAWSVNCDRNEWSSSSAERSSYSANPSL